MNKKLSVIISVLFAVAVLLGGVTFNATALAGQDKPIKWRDQSSWTGSSYAFEEMDKNFCKDVKERSNGRLEITPYPPGAIVGVMQTFDAVAAGAVDMASSAPPYHSRRIPEGVAAFGLPYSFTGPSLTLTAVNQCFEFWYDYKGGEALKILREVYTEKGVHLLPPGPSPSYGFMTNFSVDTMADFKGRKVRAGGLIADLVKLLNGSPVMIPGAEQYMAFQRGTIDGAIYPYYVLETLKLKEVVKCVVLPTIFPPLNTAYVNLKAWNKLPDDIKKIVEDAKYEHIKTYGREGHKLDVKYIEEAKQRGVKLTTISDKEYRKLRTLSLPIWEAAAAKSKRSARLVELLKGYLKEKGMMD